ncbi:MAG: MMPL family transporter [Planctomycetaceae bacterium]|nr:MMPL family transporter [Planctomycetaceae bacterium]
MKGHDSLRVRRAWLLAIYAVCSLPFLVYGAWRAMQTNSNSPLTWVPSTFPPRAEYDRFVEQFGTGEVVIASWPGCTLDEPKLDRLLASLREEAAFADANGQTYFERITCGREIVNQLASGPFPIPYVRAVDRFRGSLVGSDGRQTCLIVAFTPAALENRERLVTAMTDRIREQFSIGEHDVHLAGPVIDGLSVDRAGRASLDQLTLPSAAVMVLLACLCLGSWRDGLIVFGLSVYCQLATLALVHYSGERMNALLIVLPPLIQVLAIAGGIHLTNYYRDSLPVYGPQEAPWEAIRIGWLPCLLSSGTTALGIGSLMISGLTPIRSFGVFGSVGVMLVFGLMMLAVPTVWLSWPKRSVFIQPEAKRDRISSRMTNWTARCWSIVLTVCITALVFCGFFLKDLKTSVHIETLFPRNSRILSDYRWLEEHLGPLVAIDIIVSWPHESRLSLEQRLRRLWEIQKAIATVDGVGGTVSALQVLPAVPSRARVPSEMYGSVFERFLDGNRAHIANAGFLSEDKEFQRWRISARISSAAETDYRALLHQLRADVETQVAAAADARQIDVRYTGVMPLVHEVQSQLLRDLFHSFLGALAVILVVMTLTQGGFLAGAIAMIPNVFPILLLFGALGWYGLPVDIGTVMTASVALGIAVDDTLHYLTFFQQAISDGRSRMESVRFAYRHCARAMIQTSVVCASGLWVFAVADFLPTSRFAWMMSILILLTLLGDLCLLPAILLSPLGRFWSSEADAAAESAILQSQLRAGENDEHELSQDEPAFPPQSSRSPAGKSTTTQE